MHRPLLLIVALTLAACSAPQHIGDEYRNVPRTTFAFEGNTYRIFDKPSASKLVVTPSVANAMSDQLIRKMTFGAYGNAAPKASMESAVAAYLTSNGRKCTTDSATLVRKPQWEFAYSCEIKYTATE
jgi:cell division septation protein DedD